MNDKLDEKFVTSAVTQLDQSILGLDPAVTERLNQARFAAMNSANIYASASGLVENIQQHLQQSETLPSGLERKLNQMRREAVNRVNQTPELLIHKIQRFLGSAFSTGFNLTTGMVTTACLTLTAVALLYNTKYSGERLPLDPEIGLIASAEELELYENLDFYLWLAENEVLN